MAVFALWMLALGATLPGGRIAAQPEEPSAQVSELSLSPASFDLGPVGHGRKYADLAFDIINSGDTAQTVTLRPSCGCMKLNCPPTLTVAPGDRASVQFQMSLGRGWGLFSKRIDVVGSGRQVLATLPVKAQFHPGVKTSAMEAVLTTSKVGTLPESSTRVTFTHPSRNPQLTELRSDDPRIRFKVIESADVGETILEIDSLSTWPAGRFSSRITGLCNGYPFILPVRGRAFGALIHEPHSWNLKQVRSTEAISDSLVVRRADGQPLKITEMRIEWLRPVDGFQIRLGQKSMKDGSVQIHAQAVDPLPEVNKGFYGKVILTTDVEEEPTIKVDLLGVIQLPRKARP